MNQVLFVAIQVEEHNHLAVRFPTWLIIPGEQQAGEAGVINAG